tara:strand:+ start:124 stop:753 length:630 start_codon:yes stop_codon:yes gene_type:complete
MIVRSFSNSESPRNVLIALHGWTGNISSMEPVANAWGIDDVKWILVQAPYIATDGGFTWFDGNEDIGWKYQDSFDILSKLISELNDQGFPNHAIYILGFSQGACLSMEFMIRQKFSLGGIIPIAGFIRYKKRFKQDVLNESRNTRVLLLHGDKDEVILPEQSQMSFELFKDSGFETQLHILAARHKVPLQAKNLIEDFINIVDSHNQIE